MRICNLLESIFIRVMKLILSVLSGSLIKLLKRVLSQEENSMTYCATRNVWVQFLRLCVEGYSKTHLHSDVSLLGFRILSYLDNRKNYDCPSNGRDGKFLLRVG